MKRSGAKAPIYPMGHGLDAIVFRTTDTMSASERLARYERATGYALTSDHQLRAALGTRYREAWRDGRFPLFNRTRALLPKAYACDPSTHSSTSSTTTQRALRAARQLLAGLLPAQPELTRIGRPVSKSKGMRTTWPKPNGSTE